MSSPIIDARNVIGDMSGHKVPEGPIAIPSDDGRLHYAFYSGCCFQGADARFFDILCQVFDKVDVDLHLIPEAVCCGAGVVEERSELTSMAINARNLATAERMGLPFFTPCSTCFNVISNVKKRLDEDKKLFDQVNEILAVDDIEYKGEAKLTHTLYILAQDVGLQKLADRITHPLHGLRVGSFYGCIPGIRRTCRATNRRTIRPRWKMCCRYWASRSSTTRPATTAVVTTALGPTPTCPRP